jgi:hypothetical protein
MNDVFDDLARSMAIGQLSRRQILQRAGVALGGALLAVFLPSRHARAQPCATPTQPTCSDLIGADDFCTEQCMRYNPDCGVGRCEGLRCVCYPTPRRKPSSLSPFG